MPQKGDAQVEEQHDAKVILGLLGALRELLISVAFYVA